jgi:LPS sulfotransferase NodH
LIDKESTDELFKLVSNIFGENIFIYTHGNNDASVVSSLIRISQSRSWKSRKLYMTLDRNELMVGAGSFLASMH